MLSYKSNRKTNPLGNSTEFVYDINGNIIGVTDAMSNSFPIKRVKISVPTDKPIESRTSADQGNVPDYARTEIDSINSHGIKDEQDDCGRLIRRDYPCGVHSLYSYWQGNQVKEIRHIGPTGELLESMAYEYDLLGNCVEIRRQRKDCPEGSGRFAYKYDALGRLTEVWQNMACIRKYQYDANGNRTGKENPETVITYTYDSANVLLTDIRSRKRQPEKVRIINMVSSPQEQEIRVEKGGESYQVSVRILPQAVEDGERVRFLLTDHLGTVLREMDEAGETAAIYQYDEFGVSEGGMPGYVGYAGYIPAGENIYTTETRYYDAELGRFLTRDNWIGGVGNPQTFNQWIYALNNPVRYRDGSGMSPSEGMTGIFDRETTATQGKGLFEAVEDYAREISASGGKSFFTDKDYKRPQEENIMQWLDRQFDELMHSKFGDMVVNIAMVNSCIMAPQIVAEAYLYEMLVEGKSYEESIGEVREGYRGFYKGLLEFFPMELASFLMLPDTMEAVYEEAKEYGISYTLNSIVNNFFDGIESTIEDDLINGTAESRGEVMGGIAGMILEAVIASAAAMKMKSMPDTDGFIVSNVYDALDNFDLTPDEFRGLLSKDVSTLTTTEKAVITTVRESIPMPDADTLMQKVIPVEDIEKYLSGEYIQVSGYVTRAEDVADLNTYGELYESLRLDYETSPYDPVNDESLGVIRYTTNQTEKIEIPYKSEMGGSIADDPPFTGNGFTGAVNGEIIPEYWNNSLCNVADGAQLIEISKDGTETLRAVYSEEKGRFVPVG